MSKYKVTRWMQASVPVVSYVEASSSEEAEEESSTAPYNYDYGNSVIGDIEDTEVEVVEEAVGRLKELAGVKEGTMRGGLIKYDGQSEGEYADAEKRYKEFMSQKRPPSEEVTTKVQGFIFDDELLDSLGDAEEGGDVLDVRYIVQSRLEDFGIEDKFGILEADKDIESDIYAQDTWKNDWRKSEEMLNKYFDGNENYLEEIMDNVTSDDYVSQTGDDYFWNKHSDIITDNFYGDWNWLEAIQYWDEKDIVKAKSIYSNDFQQTHNLKQGNSTFDSRRRTTESKDVRRLKNLIKYRS